MDASADAALFVKVHVLHALAEAAVAGEKIVKKAAQAAFGRVGHRRGVGDDLAALLAENLEPAERDRSWREQVAVGQNDAVAPADGVRAGKARHGAAAFGKPRGNALERQRTHHREREQVRAREHHREVPRKQRVLLCLERREHAEHDRRREEDRQQHALPAGIRVVCARGIRKSVRQAHALGRGPCRHGDDIRRIADGRDAERVIHAVQTQTFAQQRAVDRHRPQHRQRQRVRRPQVPQLPLYQPLRQRAVPHRLCRRPQVLTPRAHRRQPQHERPAHRRRAPPPFHKPHRLSDKPMSGQAKKYPP